MSPSHHIKQSRRQLKYATRDTVAGDHYAAARSLARATSHAATAMSVHWDYLGTLRPTRRRLQSLLTDLANHGYASYSLTGVMRAAYDLPDRISDVLTKAGDTNADTAHREIARILRRTRMRARRLLKAILRAMSNEPNPLTLEEAIAQARARDEAEAAANSSSSSCICHGENIPGFPPCPGPAPYARPHPPLVAPG